LGFTPGAKLNRGRVPVQRRVDFNQGVDARILCKDKMYLRELSTICLKPLRIAFDHIGLKRPYEQAIRFAKEFGLVELSNYMLYNFHDSPADLFERMRFNVALNEDLNIRIWSFPMRYQPTDLPHRTYVGEKWSRYQLRSMQLILQATHGVVSGAPVFFKRAFGDTYEDFEDILLRPHHFIFNRDWYEQLAGKPEFEEFRHKFRLLSSAEKSELLCLLSDVDPRHFIHLPKKTANSRLREILRFYQPISKEEEARIWAIQKTLDQTPVPEDECVEDAGLSDDSLDDEVGEVRTPQRAEVSIA
jgi:hypothetical protein